MPTAPSESRLQGGLRTISEVTPAAAAASCCAARCKALQKWDSQPKSDQILADFGFVNPIFGIILAAILACKIPFKASLFFFATLQRSDALATLTFPQFEEKNTRNLRDARIVLERIIDFIFSVTVMTTYRGKPP